MNNDYFTTKKLFKHRENKDRFISMSMIDYELSKRSARDHTDKDLVQIPKTYNDKLKEKAHREERSVKLQCALIKSAEKNLSDICCFRTDIVNTLDHRKPFRGVEEKAYKVLDAPGYSKNLFSHSIDVNSKGLLAALINDQVFLNSLTTSKTQKLVSNLNSINTLKFMNRDEILVIGTTQGHLALYDLHKETSIIIRDHHKDAITSIDFTGGESIITVGKDKRSRVFDIRMSKNAQTYDFYSDSIYTVKANPNNPFMFSTGENNGMLSIIDIRLETPRFYKKIHDSGVRALSWHSMKRDVLFSADLNSGELKSMNSISFEQLNQQSLPTGISDLLFSKSTNELLLAQNGGTNCIEVRDAECLSKIAELRGHSKPVYDLCQLNVSEVISGSLDQSLRFWNLQNEQSHLLGPKDNSRKNQRVKTMNSSLMLR